MLVVVPEILSMLEGTTVPENDAPEWDKAKAYKRDERVLRNHYIYNCLEEEGKTVTGVDPLTSHIGTKAKWQPVGTSNLYACLDWYTYTQTKAPEGKEEMTLVVPWKRGNTAFALFSMVANSAHVTIASDEDIYFDADYSLTGAYTDWWDYFFADFRTRRNIVVTSIVPASATLTVTLHGPHPALGMLVVGRQSSFGQRGKNSSYGKTEYGASVRTVDYSTQDIDPDLGTVTYVPRYTTGRVSVDITVHPNDVNFVNNLLGQVKPKPAIWLADNGTASDPLNVFGFLKEVNNRYDGPNINKYSLTIEGIA